MLRLPESLRTISSLFTTFSSLVDNAIVVLSTAEPVQIAGLVFLTLLTATGLFSFRSKHKDSPGPSKSLQALSSILAPTCTSWPRDYANFLDHSTCTKSKTIRFSLSRLFSGICMGNIEIRDFLDLPCLLNGQLQTYGWDVYLGVDLPCRSAVLRWIAISQMPTTKHESDSLTKRRFEDISEAASLDLHHTFLSNASRTINSSTTCLDFIPYIKLESTIHNAQVYLRPGHTASFEFTAITPKISFLSDQFVFCSYPFMPRKFTPIPQASYRTSTPLLISLHRIIEILALGISTTIIETVSNVTAERTSALQQLEQELTTNRALRSAIVRKWGLKGWREHRFMLTWEAALLQAGCLARWSITIRK